MGLTAFGILHTLIGLAALVAGLVGLIRDKEIVARSALGRFYFWTTMATAVTGLFIFHHGGVGPPHVLSVLTIITLGVAWVATNTAAFGRFARYVEVGAYTTTVVFHLVPGFTETLTRLPAGQPLAKGPEDPLLQGIFGVVFLIYFIVLGLQLRRVHKARASG